MKYILNLFCVILLPGISVGFIQAILLLFAVTSLYVPIIIGIILSIICYYLFIKKITWFTTFEHELTHAFVALLFFRKITKFTVTKKDGGYIQQAGGFGGEFANILITLAPYYLPTFTLILAVIKTLFLKNSSIWIDFAIGFTFGYHILSTKDELINNWNKDTFMLAKSFRYGNTDIGKTGYISSFLIISSLTLFIHGIIIWLIISQLNGISIYLNTIYNYVTIEYGYVLRIIKTLV